MAKVGRYSSLALISLIASAIKASATAVGLATLTAVLWAHGNHAAQAATVYRWVDEQGRVHFSDVPRRTGGVPALEVMTVTGPQRQPNADANEQQHRRNRAWFEQRTRERQSEEAKRAREQAQLHRQRQKWQQQCARARQRLLDAEAALRHKKRTGFGITPKEERKLQGKIDILHTHAEQTCS